MAAAWLLLSGLISGGWRAPAPDARWSRKLASLTLPAAFIVLIIYGLVSLQTLRVAARMNHQLDQMVQNESRFYATLTGQPWP
jgi:hypothetical protein